MRGVSRADRQQRVPRSEGSQKTEVAQVDRDEVETPRPPSGGKIQGGPVPAIIGRKKKIKSGEARAILKAFDSKTPWSAFLQKHSSRADVEHIAKVAKTINPARAE